MDPFLEPGALVRHPQAQDWGLGQVQSVIGQRVTVNFEHAGKVLFISVLVILIHTYYGYRATGGPAGVGVAVGRAVRASLVLIFVIDIFVSLALWGSTTTVKIA